ncbi:MAG: putative porin [Bacteroidales bacterium]|jgi:hypothetical protein|nr:putative porin [Bacteroidales bacterium]
MKRSLAIILLFAFTLGVSAQDKQTPGKKILKQWTLSSDFAEEVLLPFDTVFSLCHRYRMSDKYSPINATLGNYGLPFYQIDFFDRIADPDKFLYAYYFPLMHHPDNAMFMNLQVPFTEMVWTNGTPRETSEQTFRIKHSQNVNRYLNFGLVYDIIYSLGQYNFQRSEDKTFILFSSYTGPKYKLYAALGVNNLTAYENGGIFDAGQLPDLETRDVQVNLGDLNSAKSILKNRNLLLVQRYTVGGTAQSADSTGKKKTGFLGLSGTFSHILTWDYNKRTYSDNYPESGFYDSLYINNESTFDSLFYRSLKNTIRFDFTTDESRKVRLGGGVGLKNELRKYSLIIPTHDTNYADTVKWNRTSNALVGRLYNNIGEKFGWNANGELYLTGYRAGDFSLEGEIFKSFEWKKGMASLKVNGSMINQQPSFWYEQWGGNHFEWYNNMKKEFRIDLGTTFSYPARKAELKFNYAIIDNYTDFGTDALPSQHEGGLSVAALKVSKEVRAWKFHLAGDLLVQQSSNPEILELPLFATRSTFYFEHLFKFKSTNGRLNVQMGADAIYHTPYHPYSYMPATGRFYRQDLVEEGNYPFLNVFINIKLKRTRIFVMYDHLNSGWMGYNYNFVPSYPQNFRMLRYGIAWTFYN